MNDNSTVSAVPVPRLCRDVVGNNRLRDVRRRATSGGGTGPGVVGTFSGGCARAAVRSGYGPG